MKILLLSQFFSTTKGGGEYVFSLIAKSLAENGHVVWIITNKIKNEVYPTQKNINFVFVPPLLEYKGGLPPGLHENVTYVINTINKGYHIIKNEKIDIIHSNNFSPSLAGSILSTLSKTPHVTTIHDVFSLCGRNYWKLWGKQNNVSRINTYLAPLFEKMSINLKYNVIHTVSEASKEDLIKFGAKKPIYVISNSIETQNEEILKKNLLQFIYIGRLVFYKNLEVVIKAINILRNEYPEIKLKIIGDGPHRENLEILINKLNLQKNIEFLGYVSSEMKVKTLAESEALVFPSLCEGFGLVILEAFSQRKSVLVSNVRPLSDIIMHEVNGMVIDPHNEEQWANAIKYIIENPIKSNQMGQFGHKMLKENYNPNIFTKKIIQMYNDICNKKI